MFFGGSNAFKRANICKLGVINDDADCLGGVHNGTAADSDDAVSTKFLEGLHTVLDILDGGIGFNVGVESVDNTGSIQKVSDLFDFTGLYHMTSGSDECTLVAAIGEFGNDFFDGTYAMVGNRVENDAISHNTIPFYKQISIWR